MKRIITMVSIVFLLMMTLGACGNSDNSQESTTDTSSQETSSESEKGIKAEDVISLEEVSYELNNGVNICFKLKNVTNDHLESIMLNDVQYLDADNTVIDSGMVGDNKANLDSGQAGIYKKWFSQYQSIDEMANDITQIKIQSVQVFGEWNNFDSEIDAIYAEPIVINVKDIKRR